MGRKKLVTDEELLDAARRLFIEGGPRASTREIAKLAGVSEAILFQRYRTKTDLFLAAMVPPSFDLNEILRESADKPGEAALQDAGFALLRYFRETSPILIQLLASGDFHFEEFAAAHPENSFVTLRWSLMSLLGGWKAAGKFEGETAGLALALFAVMQSVAIYERLGAHGGRFSDEMVALVLRTVWVGVEPKGK